MTDRIPNVVEDAETGEALGYFSSYRKAKRFKKRLQKNYERPITVSEIWHKKALLDAQRDLDRERIAQERKRIEAAEKSQESRNDDAMIEVRIFTGTGASISTELTLSSARRLIHLVAARERMMIGLPNGWLVAPAQITRLLLLDEEQYEWLQSSYLSLS